MADKITRLIRLAQNPNIAKGDDGEGEGMKDWEDVMDESKEEKGMRVSGPRTKLASQVDGIEKSVSALAKAVKMIAKNQQKLAKNFDEMGMGAEDPMGAPAPAAPAPAPAAAPALEEEKGYMGMAMKSDGKVYAQEGSGYPDENNESREFDTNERDYKDAEIANAIKVMKSLEKSLMKSAPKPRLANKAVIRKDDATGDSFGEKDDDLIGNRPFDQTERDDYATLINGESSDGPGPITKSYVDGIVAKAVSDTLASVGINSTAPSVGGGSMLSKSMSSVDVDGLKADFANRSFAEINRARDEMGDLGGRI